MILSNLFGYLLPVLIMCYYGNKYHSTICFFDTPYSAWLYLEILFLNCWIIVTAVFLLLTFCFKYENK